MGGGGVKGGKNFPTYDDTTLKAQLLKSKAGDI